MPRSTCGILVEVNMIDSSKPWISHDIPGSSAYYYSSPDARVVAVDHGGGGFFLLWRSIDGDIGVLRRRGKPFDDVVGEIAMLSASTSETGMGKLHQDGIFATKHED